MGSQLWSGVGGYQGLIESQDELSVLYQNSGGFAASDGDIGFLGFTVGFEISHEVSHWDSLPRR